MQDTFVTKEKFDEKYEDVCRGIDELREKYYTLDKRMEVIDTKIDAMRVEFDTKINALKTEMNEKFNSLEKRFMMMWALQVIILLAILGLYLRGVAF